MLSLYSPPYPSPTLLRDLDIPISHTDLEKIIDRDISYKTIITHHGPSTILSIFDKLRITKILNRLITDDITPSSPTNCIINHTLPDDLIIISYTKRYTILYNNATTISTKICNKPLWNTTASYDTIPSLVSEISLTTPKPFGNYLITTRNNINNAVKNGMHIVKATIDCAHATNADIISCTAIQELNADHCKFITSCAPFASTLRKLSVRNNLLGSSIHPVDANEHRSDPYGINDKALKLCTSLTDLNADNNDNITTCKPFAHTLRKLSACRMSQICDAGLRSCTALESLDASRNDRITTCEPFANTLRILFATQYCGISDAGLAANTRIEKLDASHNRKITSCAPFASTLRILIAANTCGISDEGLQLCTAITELHATDNNKITTCAPFAHTLKILYANVTTLTCGITDIGLSKCGFIEYLNADSNQNITTCTLFAKTITTLSANFRYNITDRELSLYNTSITTLYANCNTVFIATDRISLRLLYPSTNLPIAIGDSELVSCKCIVRLFAVNNSRITTCAPFARTLRKLDASGPDCGIGDHGLCQCTIIEELTANGNPKITTCAPFADTLRTLHAGSVYTSFKNFTCGITDNEINLRKSLTKLTSVYNDNIITRIK